MPTVSQEVRLRLDVGGDDGGSEKYTRYFEDVGCSSSSGRVRFDVTGADSGVS